MVEQFAVSVRSLKFLEHETAASDFTRIYTSLVIAVDNPSEIGARLNSMFLRVFYKDSEVARILKTEPVNIAPKSSTNLSLQVVVDSFRLLGVAKDAITELIKSGNLQYRFVGELNFNVGTLKLNQTATVL